ncbi:MAG: prolyl-tRNA synthetase associated domain-containing protein [Gammaproteobacteria bacterium]|jgi:Ala-tRNA(Pro) deacylase|nr:prolyl-tRNA synthetase associated domain-containing protein [Gammaproteobacteria bacterium]
MNKNLALVALLNEYQLDFEMYEHEPIFTVDEGKHLSASIMGAHSKNLFLKDKKKSYFLVSVLEHKRVDLKTLSKKFGKGGLSFASKEELEQKLQLTPGSVTPYGLLHDAKKEVIFLLDEEFLQHEIVNFHPLQNDLTLSMKMKEFLRFFELIEHHPNIIKIPELS